MFDLVKHMFFIIYFIAKPGVNQGRKANGSHLFEMAGLPKYFA
jgi:hypothetical protein